MIKVCLFIMTFIINWLLITISISYTVIVLFTCLLPPRIPLPFTTQGGADWDGR